MAAFFLSLFRFLRLLGSGSEAIVLENLALRRQLIVFKRKTRRPRVTTLDRLFWIGLSSIWKRWRQALIIFHPDTIVRWRRERFRKFWARLSKTSQLRRGRPAISAAIRQLIFRLVSANPLWRAPRIHGELKLLGITVSERTVSRILRSIPRPPSQTWRTFLKNHIGDIIAIDFFTVPTATFRILFVLIVLEHRRRQVLHFNVTEHPTAEWTGQQIVEAFVDRDAPRYLIRDRDGVYGAAFRNRVESLKIEQVLTARQSPWQNAYVERLIGSIRRECLNHIVVFNARHLKRILRDYFSYYHRSRTHLGLSKQCPMPRPIMAHGRIIEIPQVGGLHHRYERVVA